jgi:hypothetical protein
MTSMAAPGGQGPGGGFALCANHLYSPATVFDRVTVNRGLMRSIF